MFPFRVICRSSILEVFLGINPGENDIPVSFRACLWICGSTDKEKQADTGEIVGHATGDNAGKLKIVLDQLKIQHLFQHWF